MRGSAKLQTPHRPVSAQILACACAALVLICLSALSAAGVVHTALIASLPAAGDTVRNGAPATVELRFSGPVDIASSEIALIDGYGRRMVLPPVAVEDELTLAARLDGMDLESGGYRLEWRTIAADGHPVAGSFVFYVAAPDGADGLGAPLAPPPSASESTLMGSAPTLTALLRAGAIGTLGALAGMLLFIGWISPGGEGRLDLLATALAWAAPLLLIGHAIGWAVYAAGDGPASAWTLLHTSGIGRLELLRIVLALLALSALVFARRPRVAGAFALGAVFASAYAGHSAAFSPMLLVPGRAVHIAAFAIWAGALLAMLLVSRRGEAFLEVTRTLSTLALFAVIALLVTGVAHLLLFPTSVALMSQSPYGVLIAVKFAGLGLLSAFGARHRLKLIPALPDPDAEASLRRAVGWELVIMTLLVIASGFLSYLPVPEATAGDPAPQPSSVAG